MSDNIFDYDAYDRILRFVCFHMRNDSLSPKAAELDKEVSGAALYERLIARKSHSQAYNKVEAEIRTRAMKITPFGIIDNKKAKNIIVKNSGTIWDLNGRILASGFLKEARVKNQVGTHRLNGRFPYVPIRGDSNFLYYYDIWQNIYWGYVTASTGIWEITLQIGNSYNHMNFNGIGAIFTGDAVDDRLSVEIGINLFKKYGFDLSESDLHSEVFAERNNFILYTTRMPPEHLVFE